MRWIIFDIPLVVLYFAVGEGHVSWWGLAAIICGANLLGYIEGLTRSV